MAKKFLVTETTRYLIEATDGTEAILSRKRGDGELQPKQTTYQATQVGDNGALPAIKQQGAGTELKKIIERLRLQPSANCRCNQHIREMNQKGGDWCEQNIDTIVDWLHEEAIRAKLPFTKMGARIMVRRAISNARKKEKNRQKP